ncbi:MAG: signal peptidase II [Hyphococcus sp.]
MRLGAQIAAWWAEARANRAFRYGLAGALAVALIDQFTKYLIVEAVRLPEKGAIELSGVFDLTYVQNYGASFGMLAGGMASRVILSLISTGVALGLAYWLGKLRRPVAATGVAFVIGGALGNLYDRIAYGYVVDFLDFSGLYFPWVFNVADAAINVGVALLLLDAWQTRDHPEADAAGGKG